MCLIIGLLIKGWTITIKGMAGWEKGEGARLEGGIYTHCDSLIMFFFWLSSILVI